MTDRPNLYERDFVAWTGQQAEALRAAARGGTNEKLDWQNLAEEIESLGRSDRRELHSQICGIIRHLARRQFSPAREPRYGWLESVADGRTESELLLADSPSLRPQVDAVIELQTPRALKRALFDLGEFGETDPAVERALQQARYTADQVLGDWFPPEPASTNPAQPRVRRR